MIIFQEVLDKCKSVLPSSMKFDGVLSLTVLASDIELEWRCVLHAAKGNDFRYFKVTRLKKGETVVEETNLPFGYSPFDSIEISLNKAKELLATATLQESKIYKLFFPLSPFDTEPLWFFTFENGETYTVGANTGTIQKEEKI